MIISAIAAMARNRVIGKNNTLPWDLPEDMKFFREKTKGKIMIMGRKTYESFPAPLPGRFHIIVTRDLKSTAEKIEDQTGKQMYIPEVNMVPPMADIALVSNIHYAVQLADRISTKGHPYYKDQYADEVFVIGGGEIYKQAMDQTDRIYLTVIDKDFDGDTYFPEFDLSRFKLTNEDFRESPLKFSFRTYDRKQNA